MGLSESSPARTEDPNGSGVRRSGWLLSIAIASLAVYWLHALLGFGGADLDSVFSRWVYTGVMCLAALGCLAQARRSLLWGVFGAGLLAHAAGDVIYSSASDLATVPTPSVSDVFWLAFYPCAYAALLMLVRGRVSLDLRATRLDGLISGLAAASVLACATVPEAVSNAAGSPFWARGHDARLPDRRSRAVRSHCQRRRGVRMAFGPDAGGPGGRGPRRGRLPTSCTSSMSGETLGNIADALVLTGAVGIALAAYVDQRPAIRVPERDSGLFAPVGFGVVALAVLVLGIAVHLTPVGLGLAAASLLLVLGRMALALAENRALLSDSRAEALVDPLTGLANRRQLKLDLARIAEEAAEGQNTRRRAVRPQRVQELQRLVRACGGRRAAGANRHLAAHGRG